MTPLEQELQDMRLSLAEKEIHTWWLSFSNFAPLVNRSSQILSHDEKERAAKYRFEEDRSRFLIGRASLRVLLGGYLSRSPEELKFTVNRYGKPSLQIPLDESNLRFNLSHSGNVIVLAFALRAELGVDVEKIRSMCDMDAVAQRCLSPDQFHRFQQGDFGDKDRAFFRFWTRKEAIIKALGTGLSQPLREFDVTLNPEKPPVITRAPSNFGKIGDWRLHELEAPAGHQATLAVHGRGYALKPMKWPGKG